MERAPSRMACQKGALLRQRCCPQCPGHRPERDRSRIPGMAEQAAGGGRIAVAIKTAPGPLPASLDGGQLKLALLHLVRNAVQAMAGKGWVTIRTAGHVVDGLGGQPTVEVSVSATDPGTPPEAVERATARPSTINTSDHGTGLLMVQRFVAAAGGKTE